MHLLSCPYQVAVRASHDRVNAITIPRPPLSGSHFTTFHCTSYTIHLIVIPVVHRSAYSFCTTSSPFLQSLFAPRLCRRPGNSSRLLCYFSKLARQRQAVSVYCSAISHAKPQPWLLRTKTTSSMARKGRDRAQGERRQPLSPRYTVPSTANCLRKSIKHRLRTIKDQVNRCRANSMAHQRYSLRRLQPRNRRTTLIRRIAWQCSCHGSCLKSLPRTTLRHIRVRRSKSDILSPANPAGRGVVRRASWPSTQYCNSTRLKQSI